MALQFTRMSNPSKWGAKDSGPWPEHLWSLGICEGTEVLQSEGGISDDLEDMDDNMPTNRPTRMAGLGRDFRCRTGLCLFLSLLRSTSLSARSHIHGDPAVGGQSEGGFHSPVKILDV